MKVLVTAAGSPLGQSVIKALLLSSHKPEIWITDNSESAAGFHCFSELNKNVTPSVLDANYDQYITSLLVSQEIELVFPLLGVEFAYFQQNVAKFQNLGIEIVIPRGENAIQAESKYESIETVRREGLNHPLTFLIKNKDDVSSFFDSVRSTAVLKPVFGASSNDIHFVQTPEEAISLTKMRPSGHFVLQEFMPGPEFTVGVYRAINSDSAFSIVIERSLKFGLSYTGRIVHNKKIEDYALNVVSALGLYDSNNVQLKLVNNEPVLFEVNPRLSSTTSVRANFGFNEPDMIITDRLLKEKISSPRIRTGNFSRYWEEIYW